ncbi:MAG: MFS transporter [Tissierellia bacterium]|nr:MFS transporter [Tissierellia bacterium]
MISKKTLFSTVTVLFWFSIYAYVPQLSNYAKELGASYKLIGLIGGAYGLTQTLLRIPIGIISDKLRMRKIFIIMGIICAVISAAILYLFSSPFSLLWARLIAGIAAATWVNFSILYISYYDREESNRAVGIITANSKLGQLIAMFIGGFVAIGFGVKAIFLLSMIISLVSLVIGFFIYEEKVDKDKPTAASSLGFSRVMKDTKVIHISLLAALLQFITFATNFGFTPIIAGNLGANNLQLGLLSTLFTFPQIFFSIWANTVMTFRFGQKNTLLFGFVLISLVCFITPFIPNLSVFYIVQMVAGIGNAIVFSLLMAMVISGVKKEVMATTMGVFQALYGIGMVIGPIILGSIGDYFGLTLGFVVVGLLGVFALYSANRLEYL